MDLSLSCIYEEVKSLNVWYNHVILASTKQKIEVMYNTHSEDTGCTR